MRYCVAPTGLGDGGLADPQELRPGLASVAPSGAWDRGCWGHGLELGGWSG